MSFGGGSNKEAERARAEEQARQERIRQGTTSINRIFDGGTFGSGALQAGATYDPSKTYYLEDGSAWTPPNVSNPFGQSGAPNIPIFGDVVGGLLGSVNSANQNKAFADLVAKGKLFSEAKTTQGFDDDFFAGQRQAFTDYARPQLQDQFGDAQKELTFSLARSGMLDSSVRGQKASELQKMFDLRDQEIRDQGLSYENQSRNAVEGARSDLIAMLNATGDAQGAANSALSRASILSAPQTYSPLGQLFTDFTSGLGAQAAQERAAAVSGGAYKPRYDTGLFGNQSSVRVRA